MNKPSSKFSGLFKAPPAAAPATDAPGDERPEPAPELPLRHGPTEQVTVSVSSAPLTARKRGRPPGKRSNPEFDQITAYIRRNTHRAVKIALLQEGQGREFSELVEELLAKWLKSAD